MSQIQVDKYALFHRHIEEDQSFNPKTHCLYCGCRNGVVIAIKDIGFWGIVLHLDCFLIIRRNPSHTDWQTESFFRINEKLITLGWLKPLKAGAYAKSFN